MLEAASRFVEDFEFSRLLRIEEPYLVERYDRALSAFGLPPSGLESFDIDICGYSPQVAENLDDPQYLDPNDVNRRFIILTPDQARLSLARESFSNTADLMGEFFSRNLRPLHALTIKDVIYGEIEDNVFKIDHIDDLLDIEQVEFTVSTPNQLPAKTARLGLLIDRLLKEPDGWQDDRLLNEMVELAKDTGDIRENELVPTEVVFRHETFWAAHFGGIFVFNDEGQITVICDPAARGFRKSRPWQVSYIDVRDARNVFRFLTESGRLDLPRGSWIERTGLLSDRIVMASAWIAASEGKAGPRDLNDHLGADQFLKSNPSLIGSESGIPMMTRTVASISDWGSVDLEGVAASQRFMLCRAKPDHPDMALTNRLISNYIPFDFMLKLLFHSAKFRQEWSDWSDEFKKFVANSLRNDYFQFAETYRQSKFE